MSHPWRVVIGATMCYIRAVTGNRDVTSTTVLDEVRGIEDRVAARLRELAPLVAEFEELAAVAERLGLEVARAPGGRRAAREGGTRGVGARRREQIAALVARRPGLTVAQLAAELGVDRTALYRVVRRLEDDGRVVKRGATVHPVGEVGRA
jgi:hypothetical protein